MAHRQYIKANGHFGAAPPAIAPFYVIAFKPARPVLRACQDITAARELAFSLADKTGGPVIIFGTQHRNIVWDSAIDLRAQLGGTRMLARQQ